MMGKISSKQRHALINTNHHLIFSPHQKQPAFIDMPTEDVDRSGLEKESVIPDDIPQVCRMLLNDQKAKVLETVDISTELVASILHNHLHMIKLCTIWIPHIRTTVGWIHTKG